MVREIPKGAMKMKDFKSKLQAENFKATQMGSGFRCKLTKYNSMGMKEHPMYAVYFWEKNRK